MNRIARTTVTLAVLLIVTAALAAQSSGSRSMSTADMHGPAAGAAPLTLSVGLGGYSPVSYIERNRAEPGSPRFAAEHDGVTYFFTSQRQQQAFEADPQRYLPAYGGYCAYGCSVNAKLVPDPTSFEIIDGRTHLFLNNGEIDARKLWNEADPITVKAKADRYWNAQSGSRAYINAHNVPASGIGIDGYSPVSYFTAGRAEQGDPRFNVEHEGVTYYLTSQRQVELFQANPQQYVPRCGGWCALGMAVQDKFPVDPTLFKIVDGKLYLFLKNEQVDALELWEQGDEAELIRKAEAHWAKVSGR